MRAGNTLHHFACRWPALALAAVVAMPMLPPHTAVAQAPAAAAVAEDTAVPRWTREECEAFALTNALSLMRRELQRDNTARQVTVAWDSFTPRLSTEGNRSYPGYGKIDSTGSAGLSGTLPYGVDYSARATGNWAANEDSNNWTLEVTKRLWGAGSWRGSMTSVWNAELADEAAELSLRLFTRELIESVRVRFHEVIRCRQTSYSNRLRLEQARRNLEVAQANENPLDIANAEYEVPQAEAQVLNSERTIKDALDLLKETLGLDADYEFDTVDVLPTAHPRLDVQRDLSWALEESEQIRMQELALAQLRNDLTNLKENLGPTVSIVGAVSDSDGSASRNTDKGVDRRVALRASWTIGSTGDRARVAIKENSILDKQLELRQLQISLHRQVLNYARRLEETERQIEVARKRLEVALIRAELYKDKWDNAEIDILEFVRAQNGVEDNRIGLINQETVYFDLLAAYIRLTACDTRGITY